MRMTVVPMLSLPIQMCLVCLHIHTGAWSLSTNGYKATGVVFVRRVFKLRLGLCTKVIPKFVLV